MEDKNENLDSLNEDGSQENDNLDIDESNDIDDVQALKDKNKALFERAKKAETELKKFKEVKPKEKLEKSELRSELKTEKPTKEGLDLVEKTYLRAEGVHPENFDLAFRIMKETGKPVDQVASSKYFQIEAKEADEARVAKAALPSSTRGGGGNSRESVDYWLSKGELPPEELGVELRRKYVAEKARRASPSTSPFRK